MREQSDGNPGDYMRSPAEVNSSDGHSDMCQATKTVINNTTSADRDLEPTKILDACNTDGSHSTPAVNSNTVDLHLSNQSEEVNLLPSKHSEAKDGNLSIHMLEHSDKTPGDDLRASSEVNSSGRHSSTLQETETIMSNTTPAEDLESTKELELRT
uniref:Uncharacterized protein n=1 Tax=Octactis speculum TaxID=3111310 RepID=A0A7S2DBL6_9STRA|mmetsp:Transcript_46406/g.63198  ORF Transcript_46406/g.63198 Transcript_46406/m.63198 type:complete len:156 (+) Transcript_46406:83-550(+)